LAHFLHIGFVWTGPPKTKEMEPLFSREARDWVRYAGNCWIVWTDKDTNYWADKLRPQLGVNDQVLVCPLPMNINNSSQGWMSKFVWDWMHKPRL
jgi:hypothetical protein